LTLCTTISRSGVRWHADLVKTSGAKLSVTLYLHIPVTPDCHHQVSLVITCLGACHCEPRPRVVFVHPSNAAFHIAANAAQTISTGPSPANRSTRLASQPPYPQSCRIPVLCVARPRRTAIKLLPERSSTTAPPTSHDPHSTPMLHMSHKAKPAARLSAPAGQRCRSETRLVVHHNMHLSVMCSSVNRQSGARSKPT